MAKRKKNTKLKSVLKRYFSFMFLLSITALVGFSAYNHFSRYYIAPVIDERNDMTMMPTEFSNVLAAKQSPGSKEVTLKIPILMYHYIEYPDPNDKMRVALNVVPEVLDEQIKTLKDAGYVFLWATDAEQILKGKEEMPKKAVVLTFDDGYRDFYEYAYPILKKYNAKEDL
jgi:hypothetical protein